MSSRNRANSASNITKSGRTVQRTCSSSTSSPSSSSVSRNLSASSDSRTTLRFTDSKKKSLRSNKSDGCSSQVNKDDSGDDLLVNKPEINNENTESFTVGASVDDSAALPVRALLQVSPSEANSTADLSLNNQSGSVSQYTEIISSSSLVVALPSPTFIVSPSSTAVFSVNTLPSSSTIGVSPSATEELSTATTDLSVSNTPEYSVASFNRLSAVSYSSTSPPVEPLNLSASAAARNDCGFGDLTKSCQVKLEEVVDPAIDKICSDLNDEEDFSLKHLRASRDLTPLALSHVLYPGFSDPISPSLKNSASLEFYDSPTSYVNKSFTENSIKPAAQCRHTPDTAGATNWQTSKTNIKARLAYVLENELLCDVYFIVGQTETSRKRFAAHKFVLSIGSPVFDAMFNRHLHMGSNRQQTENRRPDHNEIRNLDSMKENQGSRADCPVSSILCPSCIEIELPDVEPPAFQALLRFFYTDEIVLDADTVMSCLYAAKKYAVPTVEQACVNFLRQHLCGDNAVMLLAQARLFDEPQLAATCFDVIDRSAAEAIAADGFAEIDKRTLCAILERDTLGIRESKLFASVCRWAEAECSRRRLEVNSENKRSVLSDILSLIRFPLMTVEEFASGPAQSGLLSDREIVEVFLHLTLSPTTGAMDRGDQGGAGAAGRSMRYSSVPRCCLTGREQAVSRFCHVENKWGYSGTTDRIRFTVSRQIFVVGFGLYGSVGSSAEYQVNLQILHSEGGHVCGSNDTSFASDGSQGTFRIFFKEPIEIKPNISYTACAMIKGPDSYYGTNGLRKVIHDSAEWGKVTFQFSYASGINNGTSVEDGQLPEIIFYV